MKSLFVTMKNVIQLTNLTWLFISTIARSKLVDQALAICVDLLSWGTFSVSPVGSISMLVLLYCHLSWVYGLSRSYFIHYCGVVERLMGHPHSSPFETLSGACISRTFVSGICFMKNSIFLTIHKDGFGICLKHSKFCSGWNFFWFPDLLE